jgi:hypothetical protein
MQPYYPLTHYPMTQGPYPGMPTYQSPLPHSSNTYWELGKLGAVVGVCGAGATNLRRLQRAEINTGEALVHTLRAGVASGVATATAGLAGGQFRASLVSLAATVAAGTAVMYVLSGESSKE